MSTYGDSRGSKMEAEDTEYVMDELKKSEESLRSHSRSKVSEARKLSVSEEADGERGKTL